MTRPHQPPSTWRETVGVLSETVRFMYSEILAKWTIGDLAFGIRNHMKRQGDLQVASVYAGDNCIQLRGPEILAELKYLLRLLTPCMLFTTRRPFSLFLESAGYSEMDVLLQQTKAGLLKPAFAVICDRSSGCFLLLIRGALSIIDKFTAATGAMVPFHHLIVHDDGLNNLILGYAHCGMVAAARWIAKCTIPCLLKAVGDHPDYKIKVIGHSMGGGIAALLTFILRENKELHSSTCVAFAPAACMTWDLAESGNHFVTTIINRSDLVPSFSAASINDLQSEVTLSSWLHDLRDQVVDTRFINVLRHSTSALGARLSSMSSAKARIAGAGALLRPISSKTQVLIKHAQTVAQAVVRTRSSLSSWSCMRARRPTANTLRNPNGNKISPYPDSFVINVEPEEIDSHFSTGSAHQTNLRCSLRLELEKGLDGHDEADNEVSGKDATIVEEITYGATQTRQSTSMDDSEVYRFYPPGRIMHIVAMPASEDNSPDLDDGEEYIGVYATPRYLYSKVRLSRAMIDDHYMPVYKKTMELLIDQLEKDVECCTNV